MAVAPASGTAIDSAVITEAVARALREDLGAGDVTTGATVPDSARARAVVVQKQPGVVFGFEVVEATFRALDSDMAIEALIEEGRWHEEGAVLCLEGAARAILSGERTALNFLGRLSGIATLTARYVHELRGTATQILDTRKTTPGLRALEKAAVAAGGGTNHRQGLYDAILIKENHAALAGGVGEAVARAHARADGAVAKLPLEVECRDLAEVREALDAGARRILLDNFSADALRHAVGLVGGRAQLEASGGVTLATVREIAATGVDFVSVGALTHSAPALDLSLLLEPLSP
ncbi:MAG: carboxylating nicotinate-nucleotide diphosphorylase [Solirubrobacterales bacterium]|nr:carboxylating nicotinate-nucleotide diphosphorylase [Solirubrobacterales bacterium]